MNGYAVVDFETTGFSPRLGDRIVEIGIVKLDWDGNMVDSWETLINPERHVGASDIHGISARDVISAPSFLDVADLLATELKGSVFVAHNARLDASFASFQLTAADRLNGSSIPYLDTQFLSKSVLHLPTAKLEDVCGYLGISNSKAHSALADAHATAQILRTLIQRNGAQYLADWQDTVSASQNFNGYTVHNPHPVRDSLFTRSDAVKSWESLANGDWINRTIGHRDVTEDFVTNRYFQLLDSAVLDQYLSNTEQNQLLSFAHEHDLSTHALRSLHSKYLQLLIEAAEADGVVTTQESTTIQNVAKLLGIEVSVPATPTSAPSKQATKDSSRGPFTIGLTAGDRVTVTGPVEKPLSFWEDFFRSREVKVAGIAKSTKVLVAGDPDSLSGKAKKAREYGIPIISESAAESVLTFE